MPRILLIDAPAGLADKLAERDWEVWIAIIGEKVPRMYLGWESEPPDPRCWDFIIDDRGKGNPTLNVEPISSGKVRLLVIPSSYLDECENAFGIRICSFAERPMESGSAVWSAPPKGHKALEFNACEDSRHVALSDYVEEFRSDFRRSRLLFSGTFYLEAPKWDHYFNPLFLDAYGWAVIGIGEKVRPWLFSIDIPENGRRAEALAYLCLRSAPQFWPEGFAASFMPRRVLKLLEERSRLVANHAQRLNELNAAILQEQTFYARFSHLTRLGGDALKRKVEEAFRDVFGLPVDDLDAGVPAGEPKRLDLRVGLRDRQAAIEVRGSGTRNARREDIDGFVLNFEQSSHLFGDVPSKLLIFNGMYMRRKEIRDAALSFSSDVVSEAVAHGICVMSCDQLLESIERLRNSEVTIEEMITAWCRPGAFAL